jgi:uncharacterized protein YybS (DUF2232 family)
MGAVEILGSLGGIVAFVTAVFLIIRAIFKQINAIDDNTTEIRETRDQVTKMAEKISDHDVRIHILEDRAKR